MKVLRYVLLALALLLQGGEAFATDPAQVPVSCCCEDRCPCPMPAPSAPCAPQAPLTLQAPLVQVAAQAAPAKAPKVEPLPWSGLAMAVSSAERGPLQAFRLEPDPPGGRERLSRISTLRI